MFTHEMIEIKVWKTLQSVGAISSLSNETNQLSSLAHDYNPFMHPFRYTCVIHLISVFYCNKITRQIITKETQTLKVFIIPICPMNDHKFITKTSIFCKVN